MSDTKKKIYLGENLVCQTFTAAEEQAKAFDLFGLEQPVVSSNAPASTRPVQQGQVCEFDGVDDYISAAHLTGSETVTSSVGTSTPSISAGRIDFTAGKCSSLILSDGTQYNLNHASGTTAYDSSGNGNHGTLQNGAAFVVDNTLPPEADKLNLEGYTDDSGVLKPRDESDPTNDIDGNPLQYSGSVYPRRPEYRNSYAASFDGVDDYISATHLTGSETVTSNHGTSTPSISAGRIDFTAGTCSNLILSDGTQYPLTEGAGDTVYDISGNDNHGTINNASTATEGAGFWAGRIDGEENALNNNNGFTSGLRVATIGNYGGAVHDIEFTVNTTDNQFVLGNDSGTKLLLAVHDGSSSPGLYDASSIAVDGVTLTSTTRDDLHTAICDGQTHTVLVSDCDLTTWANLMIGSYAASASVWLFDGVVTKIKIDGSEVTPTEITTRIRIPADTSDPTLDVFGDTLTNPAITDGYNGAETELDAYNIAEGDNPSPATNNNPDLESIEFGADFASNDAAYMRLKSSTENDRLITFADDLTGGDETLAQKYTQ